MPCAAFRLVNYLTRYDPRDTLHCLYGMTIWAVVGRIVLAAYANDVNALCENTRACDCSLTSIGTSAVLVLKHFGVLLFDLCHADRIPFAYSKCRTTRCTSVRIYRPRQPQCDGRVLRLSNRLTFRFAIPADTLPPRRRAEFRRAGLSAVQHDHSDGQAVRSERSDQQRRRRATAPAPWCSMTKTLCGSLHGERA